MHEILLVITLGGLILSSTGRLGLANPFQIYFSVWSFVFLGYYFFRETFIDVSAIFLATIAVAQLSAFVLLLVIHGSTKRKEIRINKEPITVKNGGYVLLAQVVTVLVIPLVYLKAVSLAGGVDIFSPDGYMRLRSAMTEDGMGFGVLTYFSILSYVVTSVSVFMYLSQQMGIRRLLASIGPGLFYAYIGTARTGVLLLLILISVPLILRGTLKIKGLLVVSSFMLLIFMFIAAMTSKGVSVDAGFLENIISFSNNIRSYTIAPFLAFFKLFETGSPLDWGQNSFRIIFAIGNFFGLDASPTSSLERAYAYVPDQTNVFTVYEVYFRDFSYIGLIAPTFFLTIHWWLYKRANKFGGIWIFLYAASVYPLVMQFFQDQYFSLISMWIQIAFWLWIFFRSRKFAISR